MTTAKTASALDWTSIARDLDAFGVALTGPLLSEADCLSLRSLYDGDGRFRSHIVMQRHGFGAGEYKYFANPLPQPIAELRQAFYERLAPIADAWNERMGLDRRYPATLDGFLAECHADGQTRPTPLLLKYRSGDYNCLHQDVYGAHLFPIQLVILLSEPGREFEGGELVLTEQRPRMQSRAEVVPLRMGHGALFAVNDRPHAGTRGDYRVKMRHGVSRVRSGERFTAGVIFHDAA
ncbi:prolyl 4-hydroxylase [Mesorhizobium sp. L-8-10]|uniref:2OG-Fe(II) oxygenase n=1 Tax=unclassified Mesorhizobium TaxID=325217 RepID=UPI0019288974|nr:MULTISPECIES: 2OG-Fe(II) oxygenase [unclassified Mesorhizobium]BCH25559.1 prolyl 4-hydroxylase [Mesorhizobium sp. L-8-3]BCH33559.1 prolyl 4-hydroxylase [Mesorhizobium sp. L-8-10]